MSSDPTPRRASPGPRAAARSAAGWAGGQGLTAAQRRAIGRMASGESATAAAASAGVCRQTVHRWLQHDPAFRAAFHAWQAAAADHAKARLLALADAAVTTVAAAVAAGDTRTALAVLKGQGLLTPPTPGPTDPDQVARRHLADAARAEAALVDAEVGCPAEVYVPDQVRAYRAARRPLPTAIPIALPGRTPSPDADANALDPNAFDPNAFDQNAADLAALDGLPEFTPDDADLFDPGRRPFARPGDPPG